MYERTVRCIGDVLGRFTNLTRGTKGLELVLARGWNERVPHFDYSGTDEGIRKVWKGAFRGGLSVVETGEVLEINPFRPLTIYFPFPLDGKCDYDQL